LATLRIYFKYVGGELNLIFNCILPSKWGAMELDIEKASALKKEIIFSRQNVEKTQKLSGKTASILPF